MTRAQLRTHVSLRACVLAACSLRARCVHMTSLSGDMPRYSVLLMAKILHHFRWKRHVPSRSHFNIGACAVVSRQGGANGQNLASPRLLPNIETRGKGDEDSDSFATDSNWGGARFCPSTVSVTLFGHMGFIGPKLVRKTRKAQRVVAWRSSNR